MNLSAAINGICSCPHFITTQLSSGAWGEVGAELGIGEELGLEAELVWGQRGKDGGGPGGAEWSWGWGRSGTVRGSGLELEQDWGLNGVGVELV